MTFQSSQPQSQGHLDQWQQMLAIVTQHAAELQPNLARQYKKLVMTRFITENILVFLLQYTGLMFSTLTPYPTPLSFAVGTTCAFAFLRGYYILPGVFLGSIVAYLLTGFHFKIAFGCAALYTFQIASLLWLSYRFVAPTLVFKQSLPFLKFTCFMMILTALVTYFIATLCQFSSANPLLQANWELSWLATVNGILILSSGILAWDMYFSQINELKQNNNRRLFLIYALLLTATLILLFNQQTYLFICISALNVCVVLTLGIFKGWLSTLAALVLIGLILNIGAYMNAPLFTAHFFYSTPYLLSLILNIQTMLGLFLSITLSLKD